jgi:4-diphosphocytidyl-2-C-methyl-D-erythritol kinase
MSVRAFAPAKINLTLEVGPPRADGYHPLQSVVTFADVGDIIEAEPAEVLSLNIVGEFADELVGDTETNLVMRAAHALSDAAGISQGASLTLEKQLPIASGIGGGSSDAAAALRALNELWGLNWPLDQLRPIAGKLGADVPVCLAGLPAYMTGTGEVFEPIALPAFAAVLINPLAPLSTPEVYRRFDAMGLGARFAAKPAPDWSSAAQALAGIARTGNDLTDPATAIAPQIAEVSQMLRADLRVRYAALSGSGATVFALTANAEDAAALADALQEKRPDWWVADTLLSGA